MKRALTLTTGLAVGYVAGTRAGKERYAQIKQKAHALSQQPAVADAAQSLRENAEAVTKTVACKVTEAASGLTHKIRGTDEAPDEPFPRDPATRSARPADITAAGGTTGVSRPQPS